jgi:hypothetical protein
MISRGFYTDANSMFAHPPEIRRRLQALSGANATTIIAPTKSHRHK